MKQGLLLALAIACTALLNQVQAQVNVYTFSQVSGTYTAITGGTVLGNTSSDDQRFVDPAVPLGGTATTGPGFPIGFDFNFNGFVFDRVAINNNGWISLGQSSLTPSVNNASTSAYTPLSSTAAITPAHLRSRIAALGADLQAQAGAELRIETIGGAPFRTFVVQWTNYKRYSTAGTGHNLTFQIRLNEAGGVAADQTVEIVWGTMIFNTTSSTAHVGLGGSAATDFNNRATVSPHDWNNTIAGTANTSSCTFVNTATPPVEGTSFTWTPPPACVGTPDAGNTTSTANPVCAGVNFTLAITGMPGGSGIAYQWQSSPDGFSFSDIPGATNSTLVTNQTVETWYQCVVTCTSSGLSDISTPIDIPMDAPTNCYCTPIYTTGCTASDRIDVVTFGVLVNPPSGNSGCTNLNGLGYNQYLSGLPVPDLIVGNTYPISVLVGPGGTEHVKIFVDLNQDGDFFDTGEETYIGSGNGVTINGNVSIPAGALSGQTRMRVRVVYNTNVFGPCTSHTYGEAEDYLVNIVAPPVCISSPNSPADGNSSCPTTSATNLSWPAADDATSYDVYFGTSSNPPFVANTAGTSYNAGVLGLGTYYWKIVPKNAAGEATGCPEWTFSYADDEAPSITDCGGDQTLFADANCNAELGDYTGLVVYSDNCDNNASVTQSPALGSIISGNTIVTFTVTDDSGNPATCSVSVALEDITGPVLNCPALVEAGTDPGACNALVNYSVSATDNCGGSVTITQTVGQPSGSIFDLGITMCAFSAMDNAGNVSTCNFNIIVSDDDAPVISVCPPDITVATDDNCEAITADYTGLVAASDNCDPVVTITQNPAPGSVSGGFLIITMIATDGTGNSSNCTFQTFSSDMNPPTISCPDVQSFDADDDCQTPLPDFTSLANASDNCGGFDVTQSPAPGEEVGFGQSILTLTVTDGAGLSASCSFVVYAVDVTPPVITCPDDITLNTDPNTCTAVAMFMCAVAPDNCSGSANPEQILGLPSGSSFPLGVNVVGFQATDASGNSASCTFTITVIDVDPPYLSCPFDVVVDTDPGLCSAVVNWSEPTTHDNCDIPVLEQTGGLPNGSAFPKGVSVISYQSTDASGNSTTCSFSITVNDNEAPVITCPEDIEVGNDLNQCGAIVTYPAPVFSDNCPGATMMQIEGLPSGAFFPVGTTTNVFQVTDASGNTATCSFTVTVNDVQPPSITCPANIVRPNDPDQCGAIVTYPLPTFSDNCPGVTIEQIAGLPSGSFFPVGTTINIFKATDAAGNMSTCSFTVTVNDVQPPVFNNCPGNIMVVNDPGVCGAVVNWPKITASDNCPGVVVTFVSGMASGSLFDVGITTVIYKATDASGNMATCSFNVIVLDNENPVITCPNDIVKNNDYKKCSATIAYIGTATATDNCSVSSITNDNTGPVYPVGVTTVTWTAVDPSGNDATCQQTITVLDAEFPTLICPDNIHAVAIPDLCQAEVDYEATYSDNCPGVTIVYSEWPPSDNGFFSIGTTMVMVTATDAAGNESMCMFNIIVSPAAEICNGLDDDCDGFIDETDNAWHQSDRHIVVNGDTGDFFGNSVAIDSNFAVVGAKYADGNDTKSGLAYVLERSNSNPDDWQQVAILNAADVEADDLYGASVDVHKNLIVVGAPQDDDLGANAGAAYIFARNNSNVWNLVKKITASDGANGDNFGTAVSVSGSNILIGASMNDEKGMNAGAAYLFSKDQGGANNWGQVVKITAVDGEAGDMFGASLEIDSTLAIIGAALEDEKGMNAGAAYLFSKDQGGANNWGQMKKLLANDGAALDNFGISVDINADGAIVGAHLNDDKGSNSGSAYIFERNVGGGDNWGQTIKLLAQDGTANDQFGFAVAIYDNFAVAGARFDNIRGTNSGAAYVWEKLSGYWEYVSKIYDAQGSKNDQFGTVLDIYKRTIVVGALRDDVTGKIDQGSASFYTAGCDNNFFGIPNDNILPGGPKVSVFEVKAYPQPFSDVLNIDINVPAATNARVVVWNAYGQEVATVYNGALDGKTTLRWNAEGFAAGTYFLRVEADNETDVKSILLVR